MRLNRAIAVAELDGPEVALAEVNGLPLERLPRLPRDPGRPAAPAGPRRQESRAAYDQAIELAGNSAETAYLIRRRDQLPAR